MLSVFQVPPLTPARGMRRLNNAFGRVRHLPNCNLVRPKRCAARENQGAANYSASAIHMYDNGVLCLYKTAETPLKLSDNIHEKIIPWTAEWFVFYELYLMCGKWLEPEAPHDVTGKAQQKKG